MSNEQPESTETAEGKALPSSSSSMSKVEVLAKELDMLPDEIREAVGNLKAEKSKRLREKIKIITSGNAAITPTGEIVDRRTNPDAMPYESSLSNTKDNHGAKRS